MSEFSHFTEEPQQRRGQVIRMAAFYCVLTVLCAVPVVIALYNIAVGNLGYLIMLTLFGFFGFLVAFQARLYLRDLSARPVQIEGEIIKKWHKGNLFIFFMPSYYIKVENKIFTVASADYAGLLEEDLIRVKCYPHSLTIELIERYDETKDEFVSANSGAIV
jgi:hypothetical protein